MIAGIHPSSGKRAKDESFPVEPILLPRHMRMPAVILYQYARITDDIADNTELAPEEKLSRLDHFARVVRGKAPSFPGYETAHQHIFRNRINSFSR
ncbi:MAG: squalene/phytoene synthase family protein [Bacteroidetes bacterium]|nr:squalene/phytoene synthase family protein [Bacteroidota bacterium]